MESIFILVPIALIFTGLAIKAFFWAVDTKQFDDLDSASKSILFDEKTIDTPPSDKKTSTNKTSL